MDDTPKVLTLRLPEGLYRQARDLAKDRKMSFSALVRHALADLARQRETEQLYAAFGLLGEARSESDVEFAFDAQREVVQGTTGVRHARRNRRTR